jgi:uncharacterized damage-inducible protein DinB
MDRGALSDLLHYNEWANGRLLDHVEKLTPAQLTARAALDHGSAWQTLLHMVDVEWSWRLMAQRIPAPTVLWEIEAFADLAQLKTYWQGEQAALQTYVQTLDTATLNALVEFGTPQGWAPQSAKLWHMLAHLLNHSTQHRTELARYLTDCGYAPGDLSLLGVFIIKGA